MIFCFPYPGGRFNRTVVDAVQAAGYTAACSAIGLARNDQNSLFWLYRDVFTDHCSTCRDRLKLSASFRSCVGWRAAMRVQRALGVNGNRQHPGVINFACKSLGNSGWRRPAA